MKRKMGIWLSFLLLLTIPMAAYGAEVTSCDMVMESISTLPGRTVTLPVNIQGNPGFTNFAVFLEYDPEKLELVSINTKDGETPYLCGSLVSTNKAWQPSEGNTGVHIVAASGQSVKEDSVLFTVTLRAKEDFTGITTVSPKVQYIRNNEAVFPVFEEIHAAVTEATVKAVRSGDGNLDGEIEYDDVLLAYRASLGEVELTPEQRKVVDMNGDGTVDETDVQAIYQIYSGG